jgi:hypothetical protein
MQLLLSSYSACEDVLDMASVFDESRLTDGFIKSIFVRIFSLWFIPGKGGWWKRSWIESPRLRSNRSLMGRSDRVGRQEPNTTTPGDVWSRTVPDKQEEAARDHIIEILKQSGAVTVWRKKEIFSSAL